MSTRSPFLRRLLAVACVASAAAWLPSTPAHAEDLPAPTVRRSSGRAPARRITPPRATPQRTTRRVVPGRVVHATGTPDYGTPYVRPAHTPSAAPRRDGAHRFRRAPAPVASPGHVVRAGSSRAGSGPQPAPRAARPANAPSEPVAWQRGKRHSTYVPPSGGATAARTAAPRQARATRTVLAQGRSTYVPPARPARVASPTVRRTSPSYADLARTQPQHVAARQAPDRSRAAPTPVKRRTHERRAPTRRTLGRASPTRSAVGRSTSVPAAAGEQAQPQPSTRRPLPLRPRPGCCADG